ncbi:MAG TPA: DUF177 domain-containing protein [Rubrivivax sp.]|nr:DUF177 domain-containing protein [Rubrivivax sp.]HPO18707.1 DUF177 domain-containing protein [Rubrivivax sp.]
MTAPAGFDPRRLDVAAFARAAGAVQGQWPLSVMPRLLQDALAPAREEAAAAVAWSARGLSKPVAGGEPEIRLQLRARTSLQLCCQRCLQPVEVPLDVQPTMRFVRGEQQAEALDEQSDEDVLALTTALDLQQLIEDELILALPLVPRHEHCPRPLPMSAGQADAAAAQPPGHAFAALAALRRGGGPGGQGQPG